MAKRNAKIDGLLADQRRFLSQGGREQDLTDTQRLTGSSAALSAEVASAAESFEAKRRFIQRIRRQDSVRLIRGVAAVNSLFGFFLSWSIKPVPEVVIRFPLWLPFVLFAFLPIRAFIRGPIARRRLRRRRDLGQCIGCGYDLTGNVSGICPECGAAIPKQDAPPDPSA